MKIHFFFKKKQPEYLFKEELTGEKNDVDNLKTFLKHKKTLSSNPLLSSKTKSFVFDSNPLKNSKSFERAMSIDLKTSRKDYPDFDEFEEFELKRENPGLSQNKNLTRGQKLFQKLRFVLKMKQKGEFFKRILYTEKKEENVGEQTGYSTGSLIRIYPEIKEIMSFGEIEKLSKMRAFSSESVVNAERLACPISEFFFIILRNSLDFEENKKVMELVDIDRKDQTFLMELLCDNDCAIIQRLLMVIFF